MAAQSAEGVAVRVDNVILACPAPHTHGSTRALAPTKDARLATPSAPISAHVSSALSGRHGVASGGAHAPITSQALVDRRKQLLEAFTAQEQMTFTPANLRRLFRLLDVDSNKELSHQEFMDGLKTMGFDHAQDPAAVSRVLEEVDCDRSGRVGEREFVEYFQRVHRSALQAKLNHYSQHHVIITVTRYSADPNIPHPLDSTRPMGRYFKQEMSPPEFAAFLTREFSGGATGDGRAVRAGSTAGEDGGASTRENAMRVWIDVVGYEPTVMGLLCTHLGIHPQTVNDAHVFQRQKVEMFPAQTEEASAPTVVTSMASPGHEAESEAAIVAAATAAGMAPAAVTALLVANRTIASKRMVVNPISTAGSRASVLYRRSSIGHRVGRGLMQHQRPPVIIRGDEEVDEAAGAATATSNGASAPDGLYTWPAAASGANTPSAASPGVAMSNDADASHACAVSNATSAQSDAMPAALQRLMHAPSLVVPGADDMVEGSVIAAAARSRVRVQMLVHAMSLINEPMRKPSLSRDAMYYVDLFGCGCVRRCSCVCANGCSRDGARTGHRKRTASVRLARDLAATLARVALGHTAVTPAASPTPRPDTFDAVPSEPPASSTKYLARGVDVPPVADDDTLSLDEHDESTRHARTCAWCCSAPHTVTSTRALELVSARTLHRDPPDIALEQASIIIINDGALLTLRAPSNKSARGGESSVAAGSMVEHWDRESVISILFSGLRGRLRIATAESSFLHSASSRALACEIADAIMQFNFNVRDALADWQAMLENSIQANASPLHTPHLYSFAKVAEMYNRQLQPLAGALDAIVQGGAGAGMSTSAVSAPAMAGSSESTPAAPASQFASAVATAASGMTLAMYFEEEVVMVGELKDDITAISSDVRGLSDSVQNLKALHTSLQNDQMNRILYVLTLVTTLSLPATICTGYYGMNFDFPTLDGGMGVDQFWYAVMVLVFLLTLLYWSFGFFRYIG